MSTIFVEPSASLHHGGRLRAAAAQYGIALEAWLDLSTGINPDGWPVPAIPAACWRRLPEVDDGLEAAAQDYYASEQVLPVAGSQAAIQALPRLRPRSRVRVLSPGYAEHSAAWQREGHVVGGVTADGVEAVLPHTDVLVLIHPNNPTGACFAVEQLLEWHAALAGRGGWLVADEAFMDATPQHSLCPYSGRTGLIALRSLGKFFGLAGARVGFVCAAPPLLARLGTLLGPWTLSGPARRVANAALSDRTWQAQTRQHLLYAGARLQHLLAGHGLSPAGGCALFQWVCTPRAAELHAALARQGVLTRLFREPSSLRLGLPGPEADWQRLETVLSDITYIDTAGAAP
ncbi:MAG TPA: threonine-phosphate decarboxylase CobD [Thiohalobacter sp.]|nr:threonine-phosphate decarboxylase CobD [Thiohalobacter sp.]